MRRKITPQLAGKSWLKLCIAFRLSFNDNEYTATDKSVDVEQSCPPEAFLDKRVAHLPVGTLQQKVYKDVKYTWKHEGLNVLRFVVKINGQFIDRLNKFLKII